VARGVFHHRGIDADGGGLRHLGILGGADGLLAKRLDLARRVLALERREIDHRGRELEAEKLRTLLDAAGRVFGDALLDAHKIDRADFIEQAPERGMSGG